VDAGDVSAWFREYLEAFAATGRGDAEPQALLAHVAVPLLVGSDASFVALGSEDDVVAFFRAAHVEPMRAAGDDHTDVLGSEITVLNATTALLRAELRRVGRDGGDLGRLTATYLVGEAGGERRVSALVLHSP
jgi:hypothetical protein